MHGGSRGSGGQPGNHNARKHGHYDAGAVAGRRTLRALLRAARRLLAEMD